MQDPNPLPTIKWPSVFLPFLMSLIALSMFLGYIALYGVEPSGGDERAPARIFQLLMVAQLPIMGYFAFRWLPQAPGLAVRVLLLQVLAAVLPIAGVIIAESSV